MRFIDRNSLTPPQLLNSKQAEQAYGDVQDFIAQTHQKGGTRRVPSSEWLVRDIEFREDLHSEFGGVCAYCERATSNRLDRYDTGVVSHHRPNALAQDERGKDRKSVV